MGLFDSIGLGSVAKALDVGGLVKNVVDGVLPHNLASVGDLAGAVVDFKTGNVAAAVQHALETVRDLPQVTRGAQSGARNSAANLNRMSPQLEPSPPLLASRQGKPFDWNDLLSSIKALTAALNGQGKPGTAATSSTANGSATATAPATTAPASNGSTTSTSAASSKPTTQPADPFAQAWARTQAAAAQYRAEHRNGSWSLPQPPAAVVWRGQPPPTAPASSNPRTAPAATTATTGASSTTANPPATTTTTTAAGAPKPEVPASAGIATTPAAPSAAQKTDGKTGDSKTDGKTDSKPSTGQTISSLAQLNGMSDAAIRDAVINGRISPDVLKDQGAVMVLQQRMNAISEMNNLMTAMMRAMHDMQMAIVQNIRI